MYGSSSEEICRWCCGRPSLPAIRTRFPSTCPGRTPATSPSSPWTFALFRSQRKRWLLFSVWLDGQFPRYNFLRQSVFVWVLNSLSFEDNLHSLNNNYSIQNYNLASSQVFVGWRRWKTKHLPKPVPTYCLLEVIFKCIKNKLLKLRDAIAISKSETINHWLTDSLTHPLTVLMLSHLKTRSYYRLLEVIPIHKKTRQQ